MPKIAKVALKACDGENLSIVYNASKPNGQFRKDVNTQIFNNTFPDFKFTSLENGVKNIYDYYMTASNG